MKEERGLVEDHTTPNAFILYVPTCSTEEGGGIWMAKPRYHMNLGRISY
jgi:hypothetical protein